MSLYLIIRDIIQWKIIQPFTIFLIILAWYQEPKYSNEFFFSPSALLFYFILFIFCNLLFSQMATNSAESNSIVSITTETSLSTTTLITINFVAQLLLKLTFLHYQSWQAQFNSMFYSLDLLSFLDGSTRCPFPNHCIRFNWYCMQSSLHYQKL